MASSTRPARLLELVSVLTQIASASRSAQSPNVLVVSPMSSTRVPRRRRTSRIGILRCPGGGWCVVMHIRPRGNRPVHEPYESSAVRPCLRIGKSLEARSEDFEDLVIDLVKLLRRAPTDPAQRSGRIAPRLRLIGEPGPALAELLKLVVDHDVLGNIGGRQKLGVAGIRGVPVVHLDYRSPSALATGAAGRLFDISELRQLPEVPRTVRRAFSHAFRKLAGRGGVRRPVIDDELI